MIVHALSISIRKKCFLPADEALCVEYRRASRLRDTCQFCVTLVMPAYHVVGPKERYNVP